jgi:hypothetical protein
LRGTFTTMFTQISPSPESIKMAGTASVVFSCN